MADADGQRQNFSSLATQLPLTLGYFCSPKSLPNALLPSIRRPAVTKYRSFHPTSSCRNAPPVTRVWRVSNAFLVAALDTVGMPGPGNVSP